ncbi:hypothetical protein B0H34DRAFT_677721 [Crassisporium funariophilum]|nr:hypothetical protein B0H34DRAFT_677721 [Crassisporium funariophilum]
MTSGTFQWKFANDNLLNSLPTCVSFPLEVGVLMANMAMAPYYMLEFAVGGTPVTTLLGREASSLNWKITQPVGTKLLLTVVDAMGNPGGVPPSLYTVIDGSTAQFITTPLQSRPVFGISANVSSSISINTCDQWGLTVIGGVPLTIAGINSSVLTNVTMLFGENHFTYVNRAPPGVQLIAAHKCSTGQYATGTPIVSTKGSSDADCAGLHWWMLLVLAAIASFAWYRRKGRLWDSETNIPAIPEKENKLLTLHEMFHGMANQILESSFVLPRFSMAKESARPNAS